MYEVDVDYTGFVVKPKTSPEDRIAALESENAMIALELNNTQISLERSEADHAALLLELVSKGVI